MKVNESRTSGRDSKNAFMASWAILLFTTSSRSSNFVKFEFEAWYLENIVICLLNPFMSKHSYGSLFCIRISITQSPSKNSFTIANTQNPKIPDLIHTSRIDTSTINCVNVPCTFNDEKDSSSSLFEIEKNCSTDLAFIRRVYLRGNTRLDRVEEVRSRPL